MFSQYITESKYLMKEKKEAHVFCELSERQPKLK